RLAPAAVAAAPSLVLGEEYVAFVLDNLDGLIDWAWSLLVYGSDLREMLEDMVDELDLPISLSLNIRPTITETVEDLFGDVLYTQANFDWITQLLIELGESVVNLELVAGITLSTLLQQTVSIGGTALDLAALLDDMQAMSPIISDQASFLEALFTLLAPLVMPLLQVFLTEQDILLIVDNDVNNGQGLGIIDGHAGYRTGLMPMLLALVGGLTDDPADAGILGYSAFAAATPEDQLAALAAPLLFVLESLIDSPVHTLLNLLPNLAYFAAGENSLLNQAMRNLLYPVTVLLELLPQDLIALDINNLFAFDVDSLLAEFELELADLVVGTITPFAAPWNAYGLNNFTAFVAVDQAQLAISLIEATRILDGIEPGDLEAILRLLNLPGRTPSQAQRIDYALAPAPTTVDMNQWPWLQEMHVQFLVDNLDAVLRWVWTVLFTDNPDAQTMLYDDFSIMLGNSLEETVQNLLGDYLYTTENFELIADLIWGMAQDLLDIELLGLSLVDLIADLVEIDGEALDLAAMFARFDDAVPTVNDADSFRDALIWVLEPLGPVLRFLLAQGDVAMILHDDVNNGDGFVRLFGANGYETALLPMLLAIGATVPGFIDILVPYSAFQSGSDAEMIGAIIDPMLFLLQAIISNPVSTLLQILPNLAMFAAGDEDALLQQAFTNLLHPLQPILAIPMVTDMLDGVDLNNLLGIIDLDGLLGEFGLSLAALVVGDIVSFNETPHPELAALGLNDCAMFLNVNTGLLVINLLHSLDVFDTLEDFAGLLELLNAGSRTRTQLQPLQYPEIDVCTRELYSRVLWTRATAGRMTNQLPRLLDNIAPVLFGDTLGGWLYNLMGDNLFTQENFDMIVNLLRDAVSDFDLNMEIVPNRTLLDLIGNAVLVGGEPLNLTAALAHVETFPGAEITSNASFINGLVDFLEPLAPVLGWLLFEEDVQLLGGVAEINNGQGLLTVFGYEGYRFGLVPILEALLMPLFAQDQIASPDELAQASDRERLEAILNPLIYLIDRLVSDPWDTVLAILPNVAYFMSSGLLQESLDNTLYALTSVVDIVGAEPLFELNIVAMINDMLDDLPLNIDFDIFNRLIVGTPSAYTSLSGWQGYFIAIVDDNDRADLVTVVLRELLSLVMDDAENRNFVVDAIANALMPGFGNRLLRWNLQFTLWQFRVWGSIGQNSMLRHLMIIVRVINLLWRPISWFL
ncbi:MAG: hypothetical protein FWD06_02350, partial [Oscillospiraceae bacterium]|nr:hypothetical protein [Oscillospiraceae bacterium]